MRSILFSITICFLLLFPCLCLSSTNCIAITKRFYDTCSSKAINFVSSVIPNWWRLHYRKELDSRLSRCCQMAKTQYDLCMAATRRKSTSEKIHMLNDSFNSNWEYQLCIFLLIMAIFIVNSYYQSSLVVSVC